MEAVVGEGGMGAVLRAVHIDLEEHVAIKVLLPEMLDRQDIVQRFLREAKAAVKLKGEHVARVLDVGRLDADVDGYFEGVPYIVMEYLQGSDLGAIIKHYGPQDPALAADLLLQACEAIAEAHAFGIAHRDIKASNIFVVQHEGARPELKVLDFGIATTPKGTSELTDGGQVIGTPSYMAPEQMRSSRLADARSDIWSMGVVLYETLEGTRPFHGEGYPDLCLKVGMDPPRAMVQSQVPEGLRTVVMKCLEKPIDRRYQNAAELAFDLMPFASDQVAARATAEQCARILSRRNTRGMDVARIPDEIGAAVPTRLTPPSYRPGTVQGPLPDMSSQRTPTSIKVANGQLAPLVTPARRAIVVAVSFVVALALAGSVAMMFSRDEPAPAAQPRVHDAPADAPRDSEDR